MTHLFFIDDLKISAASAPKLNTVMKSARSAMQDIGLDWNPKKCSVVHIKRGVKVEDAESLAFDESSVMKCLEEGAQYKFLGVLESTRQEDQIAFKLAAELYLNRMSIIWSSPLSDFNRIVAFNQYALPALTYLMWTQHLPITELQRIDREMRKIVVEQGGKHPLGSTGLCHLTRQSGGRGLRSVEVEYKAIKIKGALNLFKNEDPTMELVRQSEDRSVRLGHCSIVKEALKYGQELGIKLHLVHPNPTCCTEDGDEIPGTKTKQQLKRAQQEKLKKDVRSQSSQGKLIAASLSNSELSNGCFDWLRWKSSPSYVIAGIYELYEQMLNTRIYQSKKTRSARELDVQCRLCGKAQESVAHILAGCSALAQSKYLHRHNCVLKILFFEMLHDLELVDTVPYLIRSAAPTWLPRCFVGSVKCVFVAVLNDLMLNMRTSSFTWAPTLLFVYFYFKFTNIWRHSSRRSFQLNGDRSGSHVDPGSFPSSRISYSSSYLKSLGKTMPKQRLSEELWHTLGSLGIRKPFRSRRKRRSSVDTGYPVVKSTGTPTASLDVDVQDSPSRVPCSLAPCVPNLMICNLRSLAPKVDELECVMEFHGVDIACITETWLTNEIPDSHVSLKDKDRPSHGGGLVAYIRSSIPCVLLPKLELRSAISETMWFHFKPFRLRRSVSVYLLVLFTILLMRHRKITTSYTRTYNRLWIGFFIFILRLWFV